MDNQQGEILEQYENILEDTEQYFNDKGKTDARTLITKKYKSDQHHMEGIQKKRKWLLEQELAMSKYVSGRYVKTQ